MEEECPISRHLVSSACLAIADDVLGMFFPFPPVTSQRDQSAYCKVFE